MLVTPEDSHINAELGSHLDEIADALASVGWWCGDTVLPVDLVLALREDMAAQVAADALSRAGVGREGDFQIDGSVRRDRILWLDRQRSAPARFLALAEALRQALNQRLFLGLFEFEAHFAHYPPGAFYKRHVDSFRGAANRVLSTVTYLNTDWLPGDGGELVLYAEDSDEVVAEIAPLAGRMVIFLSEELPHEVLPARRDRYSIAGWFRLNASVHGQIDPPR
ncbi:MAG: 2OG-Fe(II) oxygenase [Wenzhouxiangella sp.]